MMIPGAEPFTGRCLDISSCIWAQFGFYLMFESPEAFAQKLFFLTCLGGKSSEKKQ